ncbi:MAG: hypothetical protein M1828_006657 [Chrysothrix sp. TS-e1954]|nr:MAG: hypothetical protein M1828_006657 [Chrysothrix sp. TS-e1954]
MKAVVFHGKHDIRVEDIPVPQCTKGKVKVKPSFCGICGTDLHEYLGGPNLCPTTEHPITGEKVPLVFGHEFSGIIEEIGEGVEGFSVGERVCVEPIIWDGTCGACVEGAHNCCDGGGFVGLSGWGGGLSEHVVIPWTSLYKLPDNVPMEVGALIEPLAVGWHAVKSSPIKRGDDVLVLGGGPIGLSVIQALHAQGAKQIIVSEMAQKRMEFAKHFGANTIIDPTKEDVVAKCRELTNGRGVHVVFDAAGVQKALDTAIEAMRVRGTLVNIAIWEQPATVQATRMLLKEKKYQGIVTYARGDFQEVLDAISSGKMAPASMITKKIKMDDILEEGFKTLINDKVNQVKVLVDCSV